ncbi:hypothetical protein EVG20_g4154 [Dentipellis fragilis]|uniref:Uncharacterized protein n=1 Tax=Dentipellis fragilis TaxID=205917 RepID=A0A4Y9YZ88_9AGAM|nr:hypothetical protein EVG20_g4154 [Dentipellis fragilis]
MIENVDATAAAVKASDAKWPALRLEVLYVLVAVEPPGVRGPVVDKQLRLGWLRITHVCRRWRYAALGDPRLWPHIAFGLSPEWTQEFMARAQGTPVTFRRLLVEHNIDGHLRGFEHDYLMTHMSHVKNLVLEVDPESLASVARDLPTFAPLLETLEFRATSAYPNTPQQATLPSLHAPNLHNACFWNCAVPWGAPMLNNLASLSIRLKDYTFMPSGAPAVRAHEGFSFAQLFDALRHMPRLVKLDLHLHDIQRPVFLPDPARRPPILSLPHLSMLVLSAEIPVINLIMAHITIPPTACLSLDYLSVIPPLVLSTDTIDAFITKITAHLASPHGTPTAIGCLDLNMGTTEHTITGFINLGDSFPDRLTAPYRAVFNVVLHSNPYADMEPFVQRLLQLLHRDAVLTLLIRTPWRQRRDWKSVFTSDIMEHSLRALRVVDATGPAGLSFLYELMKEALLAQSPSMTPHLRGIVIRGLPLAGLEKEDVQSDRQSEVNICRALGRALEMRCMAGRKLAWFRYEGGCERAKELMWSYLWGKVDRFTAVNSDGSIFRMPVRERRDRPMLEIINP